MFDFLKSHKLSILFIILFFVSTAMYSKNLKTKTNLNSVERLILEVSLPVHKFASSITSTFYSIIDGYIYLVDVKKDNKRLTAENENLKAKIEELKEVTITNERLKGLLGFKETIKSEVVPAKVVSKGASTWLSTIIIDKGLKDGIMPGLAVVTEKGIIGHTIYSSNNYSQVLLIIDKNSAVDVIIQRSRAKGIAKGGGDNLCKVDYVISKEDVAVDDTIITSGLEGIFPAGFMVGKVTRVSNAGHDLFQGVTVLPFVNFDKLEEVLIILKQQALLNEMQGIKENR